MKRSMKQFLFIFCAAFICACSNNNSETIDVKEQFVNHAKSQMEISIKRVVEDPNPIVEDIETMFTTDSIAVLHCVIRAHNRLGGYAKQETEYIYGICPDGKVKEWMAKTSDWDAVFPTGSGEILQSLTDDAKSKYENEQDSIISIKTKAFKNISELGAVVPKQKKDGE